MAGKKKNSWGGARKGAGRPRKAEAQKMVESLGKYNETAHAILREKVEAGERWAIELYFSYLVGKPTESRDITLEQTTTINEGKSLSEMVSFIKSQEDSGTAQQ